MIELSGVGCRGDNLAENLGVVVLWIRVWKLGVTSPKSSTDLMEDRSTWLMTNLILIHRLPHTSLPVSTRSKHQLAPATWFLWVL